VVFHYPTASENPSVSDTDKTALFVDYSTEEEEQDADFVFCIYRFSEEHTVEDWKQCAKY